VWDLSGRKEALRLRGHADLVRSVAYSKDGSRLVTASADKSVRIWDAATGKELRQ
jgi:WD40 repeat protein